MYAQAIAVLALFATSALAHPQQHKRLHHHHPHKPSGVTGLPGTGTAQPTGGYFPAGNSTGYFPSGSASSFGTSVPIYTVTVSPIPASPTTPAETSSPADPSDDSQVSGSDAEACGGTVTSTTIEYMTVTVGGSGNSSVVTGVTSSDDSSVAATGVASPVNSTAAITGASPVETGPADSSSVEADSSASETSSAQSVISEGGAKAASSITSTSGGAFYQPSSSANPTSIYVSSTASSAGSSTPTGSSGGSSGSKRGLVYNNAALTEAFAGKGMSWAYNWGNAAGGSLASGLEYVPQLWGKGSVGSWNPSGAKSLLSFNEPDHPDQSNIDPATAAKLHIQYMNPKASSDVRIGSPAVTNGNGLDSSGRYWGLDWLIQFFDHCNGQCKVDFIAFHWYGDASQTQYFKNHIANVTSHAQSWGVNNLWMTEFQPSGSAQQQADFLTDTLPWLDSQPQIERYAYFMLADGNLATGNAPSKPVGAAYCA